MSAAVELQTPASGGPSTACVVAICVAEILGLVGYSVVPALLPQFIEAWSLSATQAGLLAGSLFAGYMLAVLPLVTLTDTVSARTIYLVASAVSAASALGIALSDNLLAALAFRALGGIGLAGTYMPGLRALTEGCEGRRRSRWNLSWGSQKSQSHRTDLVSSYPGPSSPLIPGHLTGLRQQPPSRGWSSSANRAG